MACPLTLSTKSSQQTAVFISLDGSLGPWYLNLIHILGFWHAFAHTHLLAWHSARSEGVMPVSIGHRCQSKMGLEGQHAERSKSQPFCQETLLLSSNANEGPHAALPGITVHLEMFLAFMDIFLQNHFPGPKMLRTSSARLAVVCKERVQVSSNCLETVAEFSHLFS